MDLGVFTKCNKSEKDKYSMILHVKSKKYTKLMNKTKKEDDKLVVTCGEKEVGKSNTRVGH